VIVGGSLEVLELIAADELAFFFSEYLQVHFYNELDNFLYYFRVNFIECDELSWRLISISLVDIFVKPSTVLLLLLVHYDGAMFEMLL
jgi:hypothetical protein